MPYVDMLKCANPGEKMALGYFDATRSGYRVDALVDIPEGKEILIEYHHELT